MTKAKTRLDWRIERQRQDKADALAQEVLQFTGFSIPVDPLELARSEGRNLQTMGEDFGSSFDGQLEYHSKRQRFLLFYNTRNDEVDGRHHPRTRFSIAHELGHYYLPKHHAHLRSGGKSHPSRAEFAADDMAEREADSFAAGLLLPRKEVSARFNTGSGLTLEAITSIATEFDVSLVAAAIRCVKLSHFPAAVAGLRHGKQPWFFSSKAFEEAGCFRRKGVELPSATAKAQLELFPSGLTRATTRECSLEEWFKPREGLADVVVSEEYVPHRGHGHPARAHRGRRR